MPNLKNQNPTPTNSPIQSTKSRRLNPKLVFIILFVLLFAVGGFFVWQNYSLQILPEPYCQILEQKIKADIEAENYCEQDEDCSISDHSSYYNPFGCYFFCHKQEFFKAIEAQMTSYIKNCLKEPQPPAPCPPVPESLKCENSKCRAVSLEEISSTESSTSNNGLYLIRITTIGAHQRQAVVNLKLGLDIWETQENALIAAANESQIQALESTGYSVMVLKDLNGDLSPDTILSQDDQRYLDLAQAEMDESFCEKVVETSIKLQCYGNVAILKKDETLCEQTGEYKDQCYFTIATENQTEQACGLIIDLSIKDICFGEISRQKQNKDLCQSIANQEIRDWCYKDLAVMTNDESACPLIIDTSLKDQCYLDMAVLKKEPSLCELSGNLKQTCLLEVKK